MKAGIGLSILTAGIMPLLEDYGHAGGDGRQHEARLFGATYMTRNNSYSDALNEGVEEVVEANGDILLTRDPLQDQERQSEQIQEMIGEGTQMLFLNPVDWEKVQSALDACREAGVGIVSVGTVVRDRGSAISIIETGNCQAGQLCALNMMKRKDRAKITVLNNPMQTSITNREQGFLNIIADNDNYQMIHRETATGEIEVSFHVMANLLRRDISFDVILGGNNSTALGALVALQQARREEDVLICGIDGSPNFKAILDVGYVTGTGAQGPRSIGRKAAGTAYRYLDGDPVEKYINLPSAMITRDNLREFEIDGWQ